VLAQRLAQFLEYIDLQSHGETGQAEQGKPMTSLSIRDTTLNLSEIMVTWPETTAVFLHHKMLCVGCAVAPFHTVTEACDEYHLDEAAFREELDRAVAAT
jgi:hybrid cluster-associated redox disulfide protein